MTFSYQCERVFKAVFKKIQIFHETPNKEVVFYLIEFGVLHGSELKSRLLALVLQHPVQEQGSRPHVVAEVARRVAGGAVEQAHGGLGALAVHPGSVPAQFVVLGGVEEEESEDKRRGREDTELK